MKKTAQSRLPALSSARLDMCAHFSAATRRDIVCCFHSSRMVLTRVTKRSMS